MESLLVGRTGAEGRGAGGGGAGDGSHVAIPPARPTCVINTQIMLGIAIYAVTGL